MFEESVSTIPSIWASMNSWFTPAVLFVLLNVMIGTIAFTSTLANQKHHHNQHQQQQQQQHQHQQQSQNYPQQPNLARSPSVLQRLRSINFYSYRSQEPQHLAAHFKPTPDSDAHYNLQDAHHQIQHQSFETHSQYIFAQAHQEKQAVFYENSQETPTQYFPEQIYQEKPQEKQAAFYENSQEAQTRYFSEQIYQEKPKQNQSQYSFEQTNEEKHQENETRFVFQQVHQETTHENGSHHFDFEEAREERGQENEYHFDSEQAHEENFENDELRSLDEVYSQLAERHGRSKSDIKPSAGEIPAKLPAKMKKSASMKSAFKHFEEDDIVEARRPATVKEGKTRITEPDEEVDAKADDFINRFKQQLKLQRLDSIIRYKEMIGRGGGR